MRKFIHAIVICVLASGAGAVFAVDSPIQGAFDYTVGFDSRPQIIKTADFDGNGAADVITMNWLDETVSVFLNDQGALSHDQIVSGVGIQPGNLSLADFNADGDMDIMVLNYEPDSVFLRILIGDGTGAFATAGRSHVGARDWGIGGAATADFSGDGYADIAVAWWASNVIALYVNDGAGNFLDPEYVWSGDILSPEEGYEDMCLFDADGDGDTDLAGVMDDVQLVAVYYNPGDGDFTYENRATFPIGRNCWRIYPADFDNDGDIDLALDGLVIMSNDGNGGFTTTFEFDVSANKLSPVDIDNDGDIDLVGSGHSGEHELMILKNTGTGSFYRSDYRNMYVNLRSVCAADFDSDGDNDVAVLRLNAWQTSYFSVLYNPGDGGLTGSSDYYISPEGSPSDVVIADLDGDGDNDVISTAPSINTDDYMLVLVNDGYGFLADPVAYLVGDVPRSLVAADLDGDGDIDVATGNTWSDDISVLLNTGDATYQGAVEYPSGGDGPRITSADVDNDFDIDLISTNYVTGDISLLLNYGDATFAPPVVLSISGGLAHRTIAADLDGDADPDLAVVSRDPYALVILLNDGSAGFAEFGTYGMGGGGCLDAGDLDGDGDVDLVLTRRQENMVSVYLNNGDATLSFDAEYPVGDAPSGIVAADVNNDGVSDLVVVNNDTHNMSVLSGSGGGVFSSLATIAVGYGPDDVAAGDLDGDGDQDVIITNTLHLGNEFDGSLSIFYNQTNAAFVCGDADGDADISVADAVYVVNYIFKNGPPPAIMPAADCNGDRAVNVADAVYTIEFVFKSGPAPICQ